MTPLLSLRRNEGRRKVCWHGSGDELWDWGGGRELWVPVRVPVQEALLKVVGREEKKESGSKEEI